MGKGPRVLSPAPALSGAMLSSLGQKRKKKCEHHPSLVNVIREKDGGLYQGLAIFLQVLQPWCSHSPGWWLPGSGAQGSGTLGAHPGALLTCPCYSERNLRAQPEYAIADAAARPRPPDICVWLLLYGARTGAQPRCGSQSLRIDKQESWEQGLSHEQGR